MLANLYEFYYNVNKLFEERGCALSIFTFHTIPNTVLGL